LTWMAWVTVALGVWLIIAPFVLGYSNIIVALWNDVIVGVLVAVLAFFSLTERGRARLTGGGGGDRGGRGS